MFVNDEFNIQRVRLLCTVIKFHVAEETKEAKEAVLIEIYIIAIKCTIFSTFCAILCDSRAHFLQQRRRKD